MRCYILEKMLVDLLDCIAHATLRSTHATWQFIFFLSTAPQDMHGCQLQATTVTTAVAEQLPEKYAGPCHEQPRALFSKVYWCVCCARWEWRSTQSGIQNLATLLRRRCRWAKRDKPIPAQSCALAYFYRMPTWLGLVNPCHATIVDAN